MIYHHLYIVISFTIATIIFTINVIFCMSLSLYYCRYSGARRREQLFLLLLLHLLYHFHFHYYYSYYSYYYYYYYYHYCVIIYY